jgi:hypothetical protein
MTARDIPYSGAGNVDRLSEARSGGHSRSEGLVARRSCAVGMRRFASGYAPRTIDHAQKGPPALADCVSNFGLKNFRIGEYFVTEWTFH